MMAFKPIKGKLENKSPWSDDELQFLIQSALESKFLLLEHDVKVSFYLLNVTSAACSSFCYEM